MSANTLETLMTQHQVYLEQLKSQLVLDFDAAIAEMDQRILGVLGALQNNALSRMDQVALNGLLGQLRDTQVELHAGALSQLTDQLVEVAGFETAFQANTLKAVVLQGPRKANHEITTPPSRVAYERALQNPVGDTGVLLEPFIKGWSQSAIANVNGLVLTGWSQGRTIDQVKRDLLGDAVKGLRDPATRKARREAAAMVRTATQHVSNQARAATWEANDDLVKGYRWTSTLDSRTTPQCAGLDGHEFKLGKGPLPPAHINCRSTTVPVLGREFDFLDKGATRSSASGYVPAKQTYYDWLKGQPKDFVEGAIGKDRATLLLSGKMTATQFKDLNLGKNFAPRTLAEMAAKQPELFRNVGLDKYVGKLPPDPVPPLKPKPAPAPKPTPPPAPKVTTGEQAFRDLQTIVAKHSAQAGGEKALAEVTRLEKELSRIERELKRVGPTNVPMKDLIALNNQYTETKRELVAARTVARDLETRIRDEMRTRLFDPKPSAVIEPLKIYGSTATATTRKRVAEGTANVSGLLRPELVKAINDSGKLRYVKMLPADGRAYYMSSSGSIYIRPTQDLSVIMHELMHSLEYADSEVSQATKAFLLERAGGPGSITTPLSKLTGNSNYGADERAFEDKWHANGGDHYMGKNYGHSSPATELLTMGVERLWKNPLEFLRNDPEYFEFIVKLLK
jgi:SPP1 gp7 family putative phage head morphogenesis protein